VRSCRAGNACARPLNCGVSQHRSVVSKIQERIFVEEAAKLLGVGWEVVDIPEPPDFEIRTDGEKFGLEVRQVFLDDETDHGSLMKRDEADRQRTLNAIARRYYEAGGEPIHVKVLGPLSHKDVDVIARELMKYRPAYTGAESLTHDVETLVGSTKFFLKALPRSFERYSRWISVTDAVGWLRGVEAEDLQPAVDEKARKLKSYSSKYDKTMLLLVADRRYRSGKLGGKAKFRLRNPGFFSIYFMSRLEFIADVG
jgi:hypothetical protein